jgi:predicted TIM-barrel fold metal-dependent hydrolase
MTPQQEYLGNRPRSSLQLQAWHKAGIREAAIQDWLPIVDAHHHLFGRPDNTHFYQWEDLLADLAGGHRLIGTVWVEAYGQGWRTEGPAEFRSLGEVEGLLQTLQAAGNGGACEVAAGIVSNVDLTLADRATGVLEAHIQAAAGRLRGVRHHAMHDDGKVGSFVKDSRPGILAEPAFRRGVACLERLGLAFDTLVYHPQLSEVADLADAFPNQKFILNHLGQVLGVANFSAQRQQIFRAWRADMARLALRPNIFLKIGGMGMPMFGFGFETRGFPAPSDALASAWQPYIESCLETFGPARCMFESNFPVDKQSCGYTELWNAFKKATSALSDSERRDLFYRSACRAYDLASLRQLGDSIRETG